MNTDAQKYLILKHIQDHGSITPLEALNCYGCFRLGARCWDLRHDGHNIQTVMITENGKRFAKYVLAKPEFQTVGRGQLAFA